MSSAVLLSVCWSATAWGECHRYNIEIISTGCSIGGLVVGKGINEGGVICGSRYAGCLGNRQPIVREPGGPIVTIQLPAQTPDGDSFSINAFGDVVGFMENFTTSGARIPFVLHSGVAEALPFLPGGGFGVAYAINDSGVAVGYDSAPFPTAVRWVNNKPEALTLPVGPNSYGYDINENGDICGFMGVSASGAHSGSAFLWRNGMVINIGVLAGANNSQATALNDVGQVAGRATFGTSATGFTQRAWIWDEGTGMVQLCTECTQSYVYDMNDAGQVVGQTSMPGAAQVGAASIWENGHMRLLGEMTDLPAGIKLLHAYGINNAGQVTGDATINGQTLYAFILTPIPPVMGDTNCDQVVNIDDLTNVILHWGTSDESGDVNEDGVVDSSDLTEVITNWTTGNSKR